MNFFSWCFSCQNLDEDIIETVPLLQNHQPQNVPQRQLQYRIPSPNIWHKVTSSNSLPNIDMDGHHNNIMIPYHSFQTGPIPISSKTKDQWNTRQFFLCLLTADQGFSAYYHKLGWYYRYGIGTPRDDVKAFHWYKKSAESGDKLGRVSLTQCYKGGIGTKKDMHQAFRWYQKTQECLTRWMDESLRITIFGSLN
ncbi:hypothetical protein G9A89_020263 [Geosiphon pyriformis]|nr:hypothetical protein G9A89_020263 [Geosiphon pyriformis]